MCSVLLLWYLLRDFCQCFHQLIVNSGGGLNSPRIPCFFQRYVRLWNGMGVIYPPIWLIYSGMFYCLYCFLGLRVALDDPFGEWSGIQRGNIWSVQVTGRRLIVLIHLYCTFFSFVFKNLRAYAIGCHVLFCFSSRHVPRPSLLASHFTRVWHFMSKCFCSTLVLITCFTLLNAMVCLSSHSSFLGFLVLILLVLVGGVRIVLLSLV